MRNLDQQLWGSYPMPRLQAKASLLHTKLMLSFSKRHVPEKRTPWYWMWLRHVDCWVIHCHVVAQFHVVSLLKEKCIFLKRTHPSGAGGVPNRNSVTATFRYFWIGFSEHITFTLKKSRDANTAKVVIIVNPEGISKPCQLQGTSVRSCKSRMERLFQ